MDDGVSYQLHLLHSQRKRCAQIRSGIPGGGQPPALKINHCFSSVRAYSKSIVFLCVNVYLALM